MPGIVCAVRGGPASQPTIEKAISLAKETEQPLYFLYVVNLDFLSHTASSRVSTVSKEMHQMGEFILLTAQQRAAAQGLAAQGVVRHGNVAEEIIAQCKEIKANHVILGRPQGEEEEENVFTFERLKEFGQRIESESGATVILAAGEKND
jgi:nucleotide-binding universal stress UspA family protein